MKLPLRTLVAVIAAVAVGNLNAADWPQWGGGPTRNAVSAEKSVSFDFEFPVVEKGKIVKPGRGIAWTADLGNWTVVPPVIADGLIWACTGAALFDEKLGKDWDAGVLKCFRESDGKLLWEHRTPRLSGPGVSWVEAHRHAATGSAPLVEGDRLWYVNNRHEVVCFDIAPLKIGGGKPVELWKVDMRKEFGVFPHLPNMQYGLMASVAGYKDRLYVVTHNGVDAELVKVHAPDAPSLVCLKKASGTVVWTDNSPGKNILEHQMSSPLVVEINGKCQVIVGQGDGWLRSFDPDSGELIWKCDLNPKEAVWNNGRSTRNYVVATPVFFDGRVYIATGQQIERGTGPAQLYCIDPTKKGDVSRELDAGPMKGTPNPNSAIVWHTPERWPADAPRVEVDTEEKLEPVLDRLPFQYSRTMASVTAHDGLVYAAELDGYFYCFDAKTGKLYWVEDTLSALVSQPLWVDGKVFLATYFDELFVFAHGKEKKLLAKIVCNSRPVNATQVGPVFANGTLYITTQGSIYAIRKTEMKSP